MSYEIINRITKYNQTNILFNAKGGIQHSTGSPVGEDSDEGNFAWFNGGNRGGNAHFFIDDDSLSQFVDTKYQAYHARYPANSLYWGSEMCETKNALKFQKQWDRQVWLWAYLFTQVANPKITKISIDNLRSHDEENQINHKGDKDNHTDPTKFWGKFGKTMDDMRHDVQIEINKMNGGITMEDIRKALNIPDASWAKEQVEILKKNGLISSEHDPNEIVSFGVFAQIMNNFYGKVLELVKK